MNTANLTDDDFKTLLAAGFFTLKCHHGKWQVYESKDSVILHVEGVGAVQVETPI